MKKFFSFLLVATLLLGGVFGFSGCGLFRAPQVEEVDITTAISTSQDFLLTEVYNQPIGTDFNDEQSEDYISDEDYYITVKHDVVDILTSITVGGKEFLNDETFSLSVGNNNFVIRKAWKMEENSLMIASGLLLSSMNEDGKVIVNYGGRPLRLIVLENPADLEFEIEISGENAEITGPVDEQYTFTSSNYAGFMKIKIVDNANENILTANSIITVQKIKQDNDDEIVEVSYAITKSDLIGDEYYLVFYPAYNAGQEYTAGSPANFRMTFKFTVMEVGANSFTFNFVNSAV